MHEKIKNEKLQQIQPRAIPEIAMVVVGFKVRGNLRFLSHAETLRVFQRACIRAGIELQHNQGYNPRPKLSLPLPRSVGVEADDELLCFRASVNFIIDSDQLNQSMARNFLSGMKAQLSKQLPNGLELTSIALRPKEKSLQPSAAKYELFLKPAVEDILKTEACLKRRIESLLQSMSLHLERNDNNGRIRTIDARQWIESIDMYKDAEEANLQSDTPILHIIIHCNISQAGTIRVDEILKLLGLKAEDLAMPVRRTNISWKLN